MTTFTASERLEIEVIISRGTPHLIIRDIQDIVGPSFVIVYPDEVKRLLAALTDAAVALASCK